jgi:hypothetical protein
LGLVPIELLLMSGKKERKEKKRKGKKKETCMYKHKTNSSYEHFGKGACPHDRKILFNKLL